MIRRLLVLACAPLVLLGFVGCGSDAADADADAALSATEYRAESNKICTAGTARAEALGADLGDDPSENEVRQFLDASLDQVQVQIDGIRELEGPDDLQSDVRLVLDDADDAIAETRQAVEDDMVAAMDQDLFTDVNKRLVDLGLEACGAE